jgi:SpoIID/LytB domain protein
MYAKFRLILLGLVVCTVGLVPYSVVNATSSDELQSQIDQQNSQLSKTAKELQQAQAELKSVEKRLGNAKSALPRLELAISRLGAQILYNKIKLTLVAQSSDIISLQEEKVSEIQGQLLKAAYADWRLDADINRFLPADSKVSHFKAQYYQTKLLTRQTASLEEIQAQLKKLGAQYEDFDQQTNDLLGMNQELLAQKRQLESEILALNNGYGQVGATVVGLQSKRESLNEIVSNLTVAQQAAAAREADILDKKPVPKPSTSKTTSKATSSAVAGVSTTTQTATSSQAATSSATATSQPATSTASSAAATSTSTTSASSSAASTGGFALRSIGRDYYQGHGVGLSQWGSHGMGKSGVKYQQILANYYQNTQLTGGFEAQQVTLKAGTVLNIEAYVAGLGEVPSKACGTAVQATAEPAKFIVDNPNSAWDCWPEETIKAQVVAARSYALYYNQKRGAICTTATCQVYQGGTAKKWAADATKGQVVTYNGQPIEALYSSDNNQGSGTANNDTIFQDFKGKGTPYAYLRAFNDSGTATKTAWTTWSCTTNKYSYSHIQKMFNYIANSSAMASTTNQNVKNLLAQVGTINGLSFTRDSSQRVAKVTVRGTSGTSVIGGWWFKTLWNEWVYSNNRTSSNCFGEPRYDYLYSQTIYLLPR